MKRFPLLLCAATLTLVALTSTASATKSQFIDMRAIVIDGKVAKPAVMYVTVREKVKWERLLKLKKSMRRALIETGKSPVLK